MYLINWFLDDIHRFLDETFVFTKQQQTKIVFYKKNLIFIFKWQIKKKIHKIGNQIKLICKLNQLNPILAKFI
jgi:hypothetical protein